MNLRETYNRIAKDWNRDHAQDDWWVTETDKFISFLAPNSLVLDVGCGAGTKSKYLVEKGIRVIGIDFSESMIDLAMEQVPKATFFTLDLRETDILDYTFDAIFMQAVLLHIPKKDAEECIRKIVSKLKPGGYLYIAVKQKQENEAEEEIVTEDDYGYEYKRFFSYYTETEVQSYVNNVGLTVVSSVVSSSGKRPWIQIIAKK